MDNISFSRAFLSSSMAFKIRITKMFAKKVKKFKNVRVIIDCLELFIQKPKVPSCQKITWSNYKHWNTAKLLVGITPDGVVSITPPLWTGSISDKEIVRQSGLLDFLEEGDAVRADKGFVIRDLLTFVEDHAYQLKGQHTRCVASLRTHVERNILKLK